MGELVRHCSTPLQDAAYAAVMMGSILVSACAVGAFVMFVARWWR